MSECWTVLRNNGLLPILTIHDLKETVPLAQALFRGGLTAVEVTLRTSCGIAAIELLRREMPELYIGAGTVLTCEDAERAAAAGARFIVSPGLIPMVIDWCQTHNMPVFPGVATPSEINKALEYGLRELKFFPANIMGGASALRALASPYPMVSFLPTGGIRLQSLGDYFSLPNVCACGGSWLCPRELIQQNRFSEIEQLTRQAVYEMHGACITQICLGTESAISDGKETLAIEAVSPLFVDAANEPGISIHIKVFSLERVSALLKRRNIIFQQIRDPKIDVYSLKVQLRGISVYFAENEFNKQQHDSLVASI